MLHHQNEYTPQMVSHPGEDLREKLEELQMSPKALAVRCHKPLKTISEVLNGKSAITPDMAVQFENVLQIPARYWLKRQYRYDEATIVDFYPPNTHTAPPSADKLGRMP